MTSGLKDEHLRNPCPLFFFTGDLGEESAVVIVVVVAAAAVTVDADVLGGSVALADSFDFCVDSPMISNALVVVLSSGGGGCSNCND